MWKAPLFLGTAAGVMIGMGGSVFLALKDTDPVAGAVLFSVALLSICFLGLWLYTGKVGYLVESHTGRDFGALGICLLGNAIGTAITAVLAWLSSEAMHNTAKAVCESKLNRDLLATFAAGMLCGVLMYVAVTVYRDSKTPLGIVFCIPVFILCGFEHSIADMFYFFVSGFLTSARCGESLLFLLLVVLGNSVGAWIIPLCRLLARSKPTAEEKGT